ncbi:MAG: ABC transporter permease [Deltaproteobacteria bacterium]|jgi:ABC-2 type transport system permease protein|nr:ABC transporter permease [Syntrophaceae bacterium]
MRTAILFRELLGISAVWWREFKVFWREKSRIVSSIVQPLMWLFLFGSGIGASLSVSDVNYRDYIYPGILSMSVIFGSIFFGLYIIWDRKLDVLKAVLVAPVSRISIFFGKVLGGCTDVLLQVVILFIFSFLFPSVDPRGIPLALLFLLVTSVALVSLGLALGSLLESLEGFQVISAFLVFPLFFLSGALFPVDERLPAWLQKLVIVNPLTYTVDGVRGALLGLHDYPISLDLGVITLFALVMIATGSVLFSRMK